MNLEKLLTTNWQEALQTLLAGILGFLASLAIEWYKKKKNPEEVESNIIKNLTSSANDSIVTYQKVVDMLDDRMVKEKDYFNGEIERSKSECESKISEMKVNYDQIIKDLERKNTTLNEKVITLTREKNILQVEVVELRNTLLRYENSTNTPKIE